MTIFHHKLVIRQGRIMANGWIQPSPMTIFVHLIHKKCHPKSYHSDTNHHMTLDFIFSVVNLSMSSVSLRCSWVVDHATVTDSWFETEAKFQLILRIGSAEKFHLLKRIFKKFVRLWVPCLASGPQDFAPKITSMHQMSTGLVSIGVNTFSASTLAQKIGKIGKCCGSCGTYQANEHVWAWCLWGRKLTFFWRKVLNKRNAAHGSFHDCKKIWTATADFINVAGLRGSIRNSRSTYTRILAHFDLYSVILCPISIATCMLRLCTFSLISNTA